MQGERLRLFVSLDLPPSLKDQLGRLQGSLRSRVDGIRWVRPEGIHLTLKFLGWVEPSRTESVVQALQWEAASANGFRFRFGGLGLFPDRRRPRVLWVGLQEVPLQPESERLVRFQQRLDAALEAVGFAREARPFAPHLTLGRVGGKLSDAAVDRIFQTPVPEASFEVGELDLMQSELKREGAVYTKRWTAPLGGTPRRGTEEG